MRSKLTINGLILDLDGVLWKDRHPLVDLPATFSKIRSLGLPFILATNNSTISAAALVQKMANYGVSISAAEVVNSSMAAVFLLKNRIPDGSRVFMVGEDGLQEALETSGYVISDEDVQAVIAGMDRSVNFEKLKRATLLVRSGALFLGTNPDKTFPTPQGLIPGAGSLLAALEASTGQKPVIAGKPNSTLFEMALERMQLPAEQVLAIGDRLDTDILGGQRAGCRTALVLSGVTSREEAGGWTPPPDIIAGDLAELVSMLV